MYKTNVNELDITGKSKEQIVTELLDNLGFKRSNLGHFYAKLAILECLENPILKYTSCQLYTNISELANTTFSKVERAMRHELERLEGNKKPNLSLFIAMVADDLSMRLKER